MKNYILEERYWSIGYLVSDVIAQLESLSEGLVNPWVEDKSWGGDGDWVVCGWRPMTEKELERQKARQRASKAANAAKKAKAIEQELKEYERLKKKYENN